VGNVTQVGPEKENAAGTFKRGFGFHPLAAFVDHGPAGTSEPVAMLLGPGSAGSNTAADHITVIKDSLTQLQGRQGRSRGCKKVLVRTDGAGGTKALIEWMTRAHLAYSVGFPLPGHTPDLLALIPENTWALAVDAHDQVRAGAWVAELTGLTDLSAWPQGMRVIVRKERPSPRRSTALRRRRWDAYHRVRHQHQDRPAPRTRLRHRRRERPCPAQRPRTSFSPASVTPIAIDGPVRDLPVSDLHHDRVDEDHRVDRAVSSERSEWWVSSFVVLMFS
jgi:Transposase DDE domain group 1